MMMIVQVTLLIISVPFILNHREASFELPCDIKFKFYPYMMEQVCLIIIIRSVETLGDRVFILLCTCLGSTVLYSVMY